jgi:hypothetical protein
MQYNNATHLGWSGAVFSIASYPVWDTSFDQALPRLVRGTTTRTHTHALSLETQQQRINDSDHDRKL